MNPRILAAAETERVLGKAIDHEYNLFDLLRRPDVDYVREPGWRRVRQRRCFTVKPWAP